MKYFDHDTDATKDELIQALRLECGGAAVDAYWSILEAIYRDETDLVLSANRPETKALTHWLAIGFDTLESYVQAIGSINLLRVEKGDAGEYTVHSERAACNIAKYQARAETARQNGAKGGRKPRANRRRTKAEPRANQRLTEPKAKEKENILGSYKATQIYAADEAAAADAAPPAVPICPTCSSPLKFAAGSDGVRWRCKACGDVAEPAYGAPREAS